MFPTSGLAYLGRKSHPSSEFVRRYLEDQSLTALLMTGDYHPRHHVQGSGGAIFFATFILAMIGLLAYDCSRLA